MLIITLIFIRFDYFIFFFYLYAQLSLHIMLLNDLMLLSPKIFGLKLFLFSFFRTLKVILKRPYVFLLFAHFPQCLLAEALYDIQ